jgi:hypothetical protein
MSVHRINGCPLKLDKMSEDELFRLGGYIGRNLDQAERDLQLVNDELTRRSLNKSFDPPLLPAS